MNIGSFSPYSRYETREAVTSASLTHSSDSIRSKTKSSKRCNFFSVMKKVWMIGAIIIGASGVVPTKADPITAAATLRANKETYNGTVTFLETCSNGWTGNVSPSDVFMLVRYIYPPSPDDVNIYLYSNNNIRNCSSLKQQPTTQGKQLLGTFRSDIDINGVSFSKKFDGNMVENFAGQVITLEKPTTDPNFFLCGWITIGPA